MPRANRHFLPGHVWHITHRWSGPGSSLEVIMVRHQTIGMKDPAVARHDLGEDLQKQIAVGVIEKDLLAGITPAGDVINYPGKLQRKRPCHGAPLSTQLLYCKT